MKNLLLFVCLSITPLFAAKAIAQNYSIDVKFGFASFTAQDLTLLQDEIIRIASIPFAKVSSFPSRPALHVSLTKPDQKGNNFGVSWGYTSTGGRLAVSDHTASVTSDQILTNHEIGIELEVFMEQKKFFKPYIDFRLFAILSSIELIDRVKITGGQSSEEELNLVSRNAGIQPSVGLEFDQLPAVIKLEFGYLIQVTQFPFHLRENRDATLSVNGIEVGPGLSGIRAGISVRFDL